jgi:hypothetical protein
MKNIAMHRGGRLLCPGGGYFHMTVLPLFSVWMAHRWAGRRATNGDLR